MKRITARQTVEALIFALVLGFVLTVLWAAALSGGAG